MDTVYKEEDMDSRFAFGQQPQPQAQSQTQLQSQTDQRSAAMQRLSEILQAEIILRMEASTLSTSMEVDITNSFVGVPAVEIMVDIDVFLMYDQLVKVAKHMNNHKGVYNTEAPSSLLVDTLTRLAFLRFSRGLTKAPKKKAQQRMRFLQTAVRPCPLTTWLLQQLVAAPESPGVKYAHTMLCTTLAIKRKTKNQQPTNRPARPNKRLARKVHGCCLQRILEGLVQEEKRRLHQALITRAEHQIKVSRGVLHHLEESPNGNAVVLP